MKILLVHNSYQQSGGEDIVAATEARLLAEHGHRIIWYTRDNHELPARLWLRGISAGIGTTWAFDSYRDLKRILRREVPDVAHFHNTFPLISPAAYFACAAARVPVVQTLHNYRLLCPAATFFREGRPCEQCLGAKVAWPAVAHICYHHSPLATIAIAAMLATHRALATWQTKVDSYIALSNFAREAFIRGGLPAARIRLKPNCVYPDPGARSGPGDYALFVGRTSEEKGVRVLLKAWSLLKGEVPLVIAGEGPLRDEAASLATTSAARNVKVVGAVDHSEVLALMRRARFLVFPSLWYEACPLSIGEAFACGLPVIASRLGAMAERVTHGQTGLHFPPGSSEELAVLCAWAWSHPDEMQEMGRAARAEYKAKYTAERNYADLIEIYRSVIEGRAPSSSDRKPDHADAAVSS